jgi:hypothetical protein
MTSSINRPFPVINFSNSNKVEKIDEKPILMKSPFLKGSGDRML